VANIPSRDSVGNSTSKGAIGFSTIVLLYITIVFGFSLMDNVWVFFHISGGLFNPAVSWSHRSVTFFLLPCVQISGDSGNVEDIRYSTDSRRLPMRND